MAMHWNQSKAYSCGDARGACKGVPRPSKDKVSDSARGWNWESPKSILVRPETELKCFKGRISFFCGPLLYIPSELFDSLAGYNSAMNIDQNKKVT